MKKTFSITSSRCILTLLLAMFAFTQQTWATSNRTSVSIDQSVGAGFTLEPGKMYIVRSNTTLTATEGSGLNVAKAKAGEQAPVLYIPYGVTLTVKGADSKGMEGAGAGIYLPNGAELIITGAGTLNATGGKAGNGQDGENGQNAANYTGSDLTKDLMNWKDLKAPGKPDDMQFSGKGGNGGAGGGGAGAGIGGIGGDGGAGGIGGAARWFTDPGKEVDKKNGAQGGNGSNGSKGVQMGTLKIAGTVTVNATAGGNGTQGGKVGTQGYSLFHYKNDACNVAGGGGGGAGGGAGYAAAHGIGAGGAGGGGGSAGGSGAVDWAALSFGDPQSTNASCRAESGDKGGIGAVNGSGDISKQRARDEGAVAIVWYTMSGGKNGQSGGNAGGAATKADNGNLWIKDKSKVTGEGADADYNTATDPRTDELKITLTFTNMSGKGTQGQVGQLEATIGEAMPNAPVSPYQLNVTEEYFAGYYTAENGLSNRIYKGTATGGNLDVVANAVPFAKDATLYAHFVHAHHIVNWDYTYATTSGNGWMNLLSETYLQNGKLVFYGKDANGERTKIKEVVLTAYSNGTTSEPEKNYYYIAEPTTGLANHTRAVGKIYLYGGTGTDQLNSSSDIKVYFDDDKLCTFYDYEFIPWAGSQKAANWETVVDRVNHQTIFTFTGAQGDNQYTQSWTVTLTGLNAYPEYIYVKPLFWDGSKWDIISQLPQDYNGVTCYKGDAVTDGYKYTGSFPVWRKDSQSNEYKYKVGLVGFSLDNKDYYMDNTPGLVTNADMQSPDEIGEQNNIGQYFNGSPIDIKFTKDASVIPVLRLMPNGGTLSQGTPSIIINEDRTGTYDLTGKSATRIGYDHTGWNTQEDGQGTQYGLTAEVTTTSALTLYATWKENVAPVITPMSTKYADTKATFTVKVTDNVSLNPASVKYYASATEITDTATITGHWINAVPGTENLYACDVTIMPTAYVYVKATDTAGNTALASSGEIKTDGVAPKDSVYPANNVCNFPVKITSTDNYQLAKVEISKDGGSNWTDVTAQVSKVAGDKEWLYTEPKIATKPSQDNGVKLSVKITDVAGNVTESENFATMYYDHDWDTEHPHTVEIMTGESTYEVKTYYNCKHDCGHIWMKDYTVGGTTFGEPGDATNGYKHESELENAEAKQYQEQGMMRDKAEEIIKNWGSVIVKNSADEVIAIERTINEGLATGSASKIVITDNVNIGEGTASQMATPSSNVTLDLNGYGLQVNGAEGDITGNANVTILLKDNGETQYTNKSKVSGSPIKYVRNFNTGVRAGNWQALYLPFAATVTDYEIGQPQKIDSEEGTTRLIMETGITVINANTSYFVRSKDGTIEINSNSDLLGYEVPQEVGLGSSFNIKGSLKNTDNVSTNDRDFWVLTNGGTLAQVKGNQSQRPYHWAIYGTVGSAREMIISLFTPTEANKVAGETKAVVNGPIYNIQGMIMPANAKLPTGMYICNGKKFYVK